MPNIKIDNVNTNDISLPRYKVYTALLTQTGTSAPVAVVLENTLGIPIVWVRNTVGSYTPLNADNDDTNLGGTTWVILGSADTQTSIEGWNVLGQSITGNQVTVVTGVINGNASDGFLSNTPIEIRLYP